MLPLVERIAKALSGWLGQADGQELRFEPDTDSLEALSPERDALWARLEKTSFLTEDEKRAAIGYGPRPPAAPATAKFNPYHAGDGRFDFAPDGEGGGSIVHPIVKKPIPTKKPDLAKPSTQQYKKPKSGQSGKEAASDTPSWFRESGEKPFVGEDGKSFAKRVLDKLFPENNWCP